MMKNRMTKHRLTIMVLCVGLCIGMTSHVYGDTPLDTAKANMDEVLKILREESPGKEAGNAMKHKKIWSIADQMFNFEELSRRTLGKNWKKLNTEQQEEFTDLFSTHLGNIYMDRILAYTDEKVIFDKEKKKKNKAIVYSRIITKTNEIPMDYRMIEKNGSWKVYDVVIEGVSLVSNYRTQFKEILKEKGADSLLKTLRKKVEKKAS